MYPDHKRLAKSAKSMYKRPRNTSIVPSAVSTPSKKPHFATKNQSIEYRETMSASKNSTPDAKFGRCCCWSAQPVWTGAGSACSLGRVEELFAGRPAGGVSDQRKGEGERGTPTTDPARQVPSPRPPAYSSAELRPDSNTTTRHH